MNSIQAAYLAGIIDGEGSICIYKSIRKRDNGLNRTPVYILMVTVGMIEPALAIHYLHDLWNGWLQRSGQQLTRMGCKNGDIIRWSRSSRHALEFLKIVYPYLIVKKAQAELGIKFQEELQNSSGRSTGRSQWREGSRWIARPQDVTDLYDGYYRAMKSLNHPQRLNEIPPVGTGEVIV